MRPFTLQRIVLDRFYTLRPSRVRAALQVLYFIRLTSSTLSSPFSLLYFIIRFLIFAVYPLYEAGASSRVVQTKRDS